MPDHGSYHTASMNLLKPRFSLGNTYATSGVTQWAEHEKADLSRYLRQHHCGQWGDLCSEDKQANEDALVSGARIFSSYKIGEKKIFVITESDRSMTTIMLASEY